MRAEMDDVNIKAIVDDLERGNLQNAEAVCRDHLAQKPDAEGVQVLLALGLWRQGRQDEALAIYAELVMLHPDSVVHWRNYSTALREAGQWSAAEAACAQAVRIDPDDADWLELHGMLLRELGRSTEARESFLRAFGKSPESPSIRIHGALACIACRDSRAELLLRPWRSWLPLDDTLESELAEALAQHGDAAGALELFEDLLQRHPEDARMRLRLAGLYERVNQLDKAKLFLEQAVRDSADAHTSLGESREVVHQRARIAMRERNYNAALAMLTRIGAVDQSDYPYWFELAAAQDKLGNTAEAMVALAQAHKLQIAQVQGDHPDWFEPGARTLPQHNPRITPEDFSSWPALGAPDVGQSPVFVVGFPRSGTTLLEQMLDSHPRLQSMDERPFFNMLSAQLENSTGFVVPGDLGRLDQRDCDELRLGYLTFACSKVPRRWGSRLVDKNPMNILWLPMMYRLYPNAKFILAIRHPCDVLLSCYMQNFMASTLGAICETLPKLATGYVGAMEHWLYHQDLFKPDVLVWRYEDLLADPQTQVEKLANFLGLDHADSMLGFDRRAREKGFIATPSYTQVIEPINTKGIGRWLRYREYFEPVLPILEPMLRHWGYATDTPATVEH